MNSLATLARRARGSRGIARNTVVSGVNAVMRLGVGFVLLPVLLNGVGRDRAGLFFFATTLTGYFTAVDLSINASVTRYVAEHRALDEQEELAATLRSSLLLLTGFGLLAALILVIVGVTASHSLFSKPDLRSAVEPTFLVTAATSALYWPSRIGVASLNGIERYDQSAQIQIATSLLLLGGIAWLAHEHASVPVLCGLYGVVTVLEGALSALLAWRPLGVCRDWLKGSWLTGERLGTVLKFGAAAFVIGISDTLINGFDRAVVGAVVGVAAIAAYTAAQQPQVAVRTIASLPGLALISPIARLWATERMQQVRDLVNIATLFSIVIPVPIGVLVLVLAHPFVVAWLGTQYSHYTPYVQLFAVYWLFNCCTVGVSSALYGIGRLENYARIVIVAGVVSLPLSVGLTYAWGTSGVIWGTLIPSAVAVPVFLWYSLRLLRIPIRDFVTTVLLPTYGSLLVWSGVVVAAKLALNPTGYPGLIAFSAPAVLLYWGAWAPRLSENVRLARAEAAAQTAEP
ncbi:MAG: lipopolysaccharide biosynthesis protein [Solirubrobacteraceae bacterium]